VGPSIHCTFRVPGGRHTGYFSSSIGTDRPLPGPVGGVRLPAAREQEGDTHASHRVCPGVHERAGRLSLQIPSLSTCSSSVQANTSQTREKALWRVAQWPTRSTHKTIRTLRGTPSTQSIMSCIMEIAPSSILASRGFGRCPDKVQVPKAVTGWLVSLRPGAGGTCICRRASSRLLMLGERRDLTGAYFPQESPYRIACLG
jgi:hypothetical protein